MAQYEFQDNELILKVKKSPLFLRVIFFLLSVLSFVLPITGLLLSMSDGNRLHIGFVLGLGLFGLLGFYLLRVSLWNTYGCEKLKFGNENVTYEADYGWFKDGKKTVAISPLTFQLNQIGFEDDNVGVLVISDAEQSIICATKMPISEIEELIGILERNKTNYSLRT